MTTQNIFLSLATIFLLLITACNSDAQNTGQNSSSATEAEVEVIQFHSEHRCRTCLTIETLTQETLKSYPDVGFSLVNVDDEKNEALANKFEAFGTALFIHHPESGKKKELTDFAFMNAGNKEKFMEGLKKEIDKFVD